MAKEKDEIEKEDDAQVLKRLLGSYRLCNKPLMRGGPCPFMVRRDSECVNATNHARGRPQDEEF